MGNELGLYMKELLRELEESGLSMVLVNKAVNAAVKATRAEENLLAVCDEITKAGRADVSGRLWVEHVASLLASVPRQHRRKFIDIVLKLAEGMKEVRRGDKE